MCARHPWVHLCAAQGTEQSAVSQETSHHLLFRASKGAIITQPTPRGKKTAGPRLKAPSHTFVKPHAYSV